MIACVGGGSNSIGIFHAFLADESVRLIGCEAGGDGLDTGRHAATMVAGSDGVLHGMRTRVLQDSDGQTLATHSISAGLDYPGVGPEHAWLAESGRASYRAITDTGAMEAFALLCRTEGIIPALESAHALAGALQVGKEAGPRCWSTCQAGATGRHHRLPLVRAPERRSAGRGGRPVTGVAAAFARAAGEGRAALVGYVPVLSHRGRGDRRRPGDCRIRRGRDRDRAALHRPLLDGPVIQTAVDRALVNGTRVTDVLRTVEAVAVSGVPVLVMTYWNPVDHYGVRRFARDLAAAGGCGLITPDLTPEEAGPWLDAAAEHDLDRVFLVAPSSTPERIELITKVCAGFVYAVSVMGITGARDRVGEVAERRGAGSGPAAAQVAVGLGVCDGAQAPPRSPVRGRRDRRPAFVQRLLDAPDPTAYLRGARPGRRPGGGGPRPARAAR